MSGIKTYKTQQRYPSPKPDIAAAISHQYGISHARYRMYDIIQGSYDETLYCHTTRYHADFYTTSYTPPIRDGGFSIKDYNVRESRKALGVQGALEAKSPDPLHERATRLSPLQPDRTAVEVKAS